jgi:hypothetical protein
MAVSRRAPKLVASDSCYLDPLGCDSTISYKIIDGPRRTWGNVQLADCNRRIEWYFGADDSVDKVDRAISILQDFRDQLLTARESRKKAVVRKRKAKPRSTVATAA